MAGMVLDLINSVAFFDKFCCFFWKPASMTCKDLSKISVLGREALLRTILKFRWLGNRPWPAGGNNVFKTSAAVGPFQPRTLFSVATMLLDVGYEKNNVLLLFRHLRQDDWALCFCLSVCYLVFRYWQLCPSWAFGHDRHSVCYFLRALLPFLFFLTFTLESAVDVERGLEVPCQHDVGSGGMPAGSAAG